MLCPQLEHGTAVCCSVCSHPSAVHTWYSCVLPSVRSPFNRAHTVQLCAVQCALTLQLAVHMLTQALHLMHAVGKPWGPVLAPRTEQHLLLWSLALKQDSNVTGWHCVRRELSAVLWSIPRCHPVALIIPCSLFQGNDQVRFELTCYSLAPQIKVRCCSSP